jgi:DNA-binding GntR family transcriptional regulator
MVRLAGGRPHQWTGTGHPITSSRTDRSTRSTVWNLTGVEHARNADVQENSPEDITTLKIPTDIPVLITRRVNNDPDGRPIALEETR